MRRLLITFLAVSLSLTTLFLTGCEEDSVYPDINQKDNDPEEETPPEPQTRTELINLHIAELNIDSLESYVRWLENMKTRFMYADNRREVARQILSRFFEFGFTNAYLDSFTMVYNNEDIWQYNVVATITGEEYPDSLYIIGGHYDCINNAGNSFVFAPGANDNASGVATTLEVARIMKEKKLKPRSSIRFIAFAAEEKGFRGSYYYANRARANDEKISVMLNNDMVAYWPGDEPGIWTLNIIDYKESLPLRHTADRICTEYTSLVTINDNTYRQYSDSYPFADNDFRALFFTSNAEDPNYHTYNDVADACNFDFCLEVAKLNYAFLVEMNMEYILSSTH